MKNILLFVFGVLMVVFGTSTYLLYTGQGGSLSDKVSKASTEVVPARLIKKDFSGRIFIVTRGGGSVPLGGVVVSFYSYNNFKGLLPGMYESIAKNVYAHSARFSEEYEKEDALSREYDKVAKRSQSAANKIYKKEKEVAKERKAAYWSIYHSTSSRVFFESLPKPYFTTQTDPDGKFKISLSADGVVVAVACASRLILNNTERYCWFTKMDGSGEVFMNNHNMFGVGSNDSAIPMPELSGECEYRYSCKEQVDIVRAAYAPYFVSSAAGSGKR
ncbi:hypothetical protein ACFPTX_11075 [Pseudomonas sp. GCM10022188]|uniref:hypothetical protein n=1 Tax=Pseudomonas TaxID=286 RepID=UPI001E5A652E|nr:hypothetical protein [Pseudomonas oryzagri]MCC6073673.1 hypothetical protein [Pseudomonas oryzagri]